MVIFLVFYGDFSRVFEFSMGCPRFSMVLIFCFLDFLGYSLGLSS